MAADVTLENVADVVSASLSFCTLRYVVETPSLLDSDDHHFMTTTYNFLWLLDQYKGEYYFSEQSNLSIS